MVTLWGRQWSRAGYRLEIGALDGRDAIEAFAAGARELAAAPT